MTSNNLTNSNTDPMQLANLSNQDLMRRIAADVQTNEDHLVFHLSEDGQSEVDRLIELILFFSQYFEDHILTLFQFRISVLRKRDNGLRKLCQECSLDAEQTTVTGRTTKQTTKYVAATFVRRHDTVGDHEGTGCPCVHGCHVPVSSAVEPDAVPGGGCNLPGGGVPRGDCRQLQLQRKRKEQYREREKYGPVPAGYTD